MGESITRKIIRSHFVSGSMKAGENQGVSLVRRWDGDKS